MTHTLTHGSLFSGIGGFDLAARWAGIENIFQVEIDKFCQKTLKKNFPNAKKYTDIKEFSGNDYRGRIDIISGGFPCQPFSIAGQRTGTADNRWLWSEMFRVISEIQPSWVIAENVYGFVNWGDGMALEQVCVEMESIGYGIQPYIIPASAVNAPHRRYRVWIVAHQFQASGIQNDIADTHGQGFQGSDEGTNRVGGCQRMYGRYDFNSDWLEVAAELCGMDDGLPGKLDKNKRIKALGNAIVPQIAYEIFKTIKEVDYEHTNT